jgi:hypothetical protein
MSHSIASRASNASSKMLEDLASRSQTKYVIIYLEYLKYKDHLMINK